MDSVGFISSVRRALFIGGAALVVTGGCSSIPLPSSGPTGSDIVRQRTENMPAMQVVDIDDALVRRILASEKRTHFADFFPDRSAAGYRVGAGDVLEISVWEAPPATLFGSTIVDPRGGIGTSRVTTFPEQMVLPEGTINIPFAGSVPVARKSPQEVEAEIARRLTGKANQPQVMMRVTRNATSNVTVVGEVAQSMRVPLTAKGERLLDAIAAAGGLRQPVGKTTIQVTRGEAVHSMAMDNIIQDPKQNIVLQPGDVVTALFQPMSFLSLGATGKNEEVFFEVQGITLAQALARSGGLVDTRADARGVFIFRFEEPLVLGIAGNNPTLTPDGKVPVVYRVDLKDPGSFFVAQGFPMRNKDVMFVSNAPAAEFQKFLNILTSSIYSVRSLESLVRQ